MATRISQTPQNPYNTIMTLEVNYGLQLTMIHLYWLINFNKYTTAIQDVDNRGNSKQAMGSMYLTGGITIHTQWFSPGGKFVLHPPKDI